MEREDHALSISGAVLDTYRKGEEQMVMFMRVQAWTWGLGVTFGVEQGPEAGHVSEDQLVGILFDIWTPCLMAVWQLG